MITTATYTRGTATTRITTAALANTPGTWVLTVDADAERKALLAAHDITSDAEVNNPTAKTGTTLRQVERAEAVLHTGGRRAQRTYTLHFTDGSYAHGNAPATTWTRVEAPAAPAAEETAPLAVVTLDGQDTTVEVTATPAAEETTKAYRIGKLLREYVLANAAASESELAAHIASRNVCYDGTATLRVTARWAEQLINLASDMDAEHKAAARAARRTLYALFA